MSKIHVLFVDDEPDIREIFREQFEFEGWVVEEAESLSRALSLISRKSPHVVLSDVRMPGGSGMELLARIKAEVTPLPLFFFVSGYTETNREEILALGASDLFSKPFDLREVVTSIKNRLMLA